MEKSSIEEIASHDENLLEKYLAEEPLSDAEIKMLSEMDVLKMFLYQHYVVLHLKIKGSTPTDAVNDFLPSPVDIGSISGFDPNNNDIEFLESI